MEEFIEGFTGGVTVTILKNIIHKKALYENVLSNGFVSGVSVLLYENTEKLNATIMTVLLYELLHKNCCFIKIIKDIIILYITVDIILYLKENYHISDLVIEIIFFFISLIT